jgi:hypothetical protein
MKKIRLLILLLLLLILGPFITFGQSHIFHTYDEISSWCIQRGYTIVNEKSIIDNTFMISYSDLSDNSKCWFAFDNDTKRCIYFANLLPNSDLAVSRKTLNELYTIDGTDEWSYKTTNSVVKISLRIREDAPSYFMVIMKAVNNPKK